MALRDERCDACTGATPRVAGEELAAARGQLDAAWAVGDGETRLRRGLRSRDFASAFALATRIALLAEAEGHHPDIGVGWGRLDIELTTHAVGGLTRNDLIMAARIDGLIEETAWARRGQTRAEAAAAVPSEARAEGG